MSAPFPCLHAQRLPILRYQTPQLELQGYACHAPVLLMPDGVYEWTAASVDGDVTALMVFLASKKGLLGDFFLLGTGTRSAFPSSAFRGGIDSLGLGLEFMDSAAAARTYNVLYAENRMFVAGFLLA